jgi:hypothetical protein
MSDLVFFLEEASARVLLEGIWPRLVAPDRNVNPQYRVFEGKQDLERQLERKLRGYQNPDACIIVMRDQDRDPDCRAVKRRLRDICRRANRTEAVIRIACHEIETFYLGDLHAVERGLEISGLAAKQRRAKFRNPDLLQHPSMELEKLTVKRYQKVSGSRAIAPHLDLGSRRSPSFWHLIQAIRNAVERLAARDA